MPYYIKPRLTFTTNPENVVTDPGPNSWSMSLNTLPTADIVSGANKGRLAVGNTKNELITTSTTQKQLVDGFDEGGATKTVGSVGCYIYLKNHSVTAGEHILIGIVSGTLINDAGNTVTGTNTPRVPSAGSTAGDSSLHITTNLTARTFTLEPGEFAFFPFDFTGDIYYESATGAPKLEFWKFDK